MAYYKSAHCVIEGDVTIEKDANIWHYAVLRGDEGPIYVGEGSNVQDGCVLHNDADTAIHIGKGVTIGHRAVIHGCTIEDDVLVGMGAIVMNGAHLGRGSIIAAGAVVLGGMEVPENSLVMGVPAKVRGEVSAEQLEASRNNATTYVTLGHDKLLRVE